MERAKAWLQLAGVVFGLLGGLYTAGLALSDTVVTSNELVDHDVGTRAHPPIQEAVARCEAKAVAAQRRIEELRADQVAMGARMVRMISAEIEPRPALRAARASFYEETYRSLLNQGMPIEEATLEALRTSWLTRPR